jgi:hypothetical protein
MLSTLADAVANIPKIRSVPEGILGTTVTLGNILQGVSASLLVTILTVVLRHLRQTRKDKSDGDIALRTLENAEDSSLRADLMAMVVSRDTRISQLEHDVVEERKRCAEEMNAMQKRHDEAVAGLYGEIKGLRDNMIQQAKSGDVLRVHANAPMSVDKFFRPEDPAE